MLPHVFNRRLIARHRRRAIDAAVEGLDFLVTIAAEDIAERLQSVSRSFETALVIGGPTDALARAVQQSGKVGRVIRADLFTPGLGTDPKPHVAIDDERLPFAGESLDLVVSSLTLQWANDIPGALVQIRRALRPDGLFLANLIGGDTLTELREAFLAAESEITGGVTPRVAPFADVRDIGGLLQRAGFALPVADIDRLMLRYETPFHLMRELATMGAGNALTERARGLLSPRILERAATHYAAAHADDDGRIRATIAILSMSGWAPHESQQKPLRPGTAKARLADALGAEERPLPSGS
jgi:SAM-dependent methyltransferase